MRDIKMDLLSVEILTSRLRLKPVSMAYKEEIFSGFSEEITTYMCPRSPQEISEIEAFIESAIVDLEKGSDLILVILKKDSQEFLGCAGLHGMLGKTPEFGIWLKKTAHGYKYGLEAIRGIKNWAEQNLDYEYFLYPVDRANIASRKIPETLGGKVVREYKHKKTNGNILYLLEYRIEKS
ncbi:GNAT family N-acetyltransferase [cyanobacterium TDX16]|nr:GNAT family N-acetyltransferase [cyanobacterium TDX16]